MEHIYIYICFFYNWLNSFLISFVEISNIFQSHRYTFIAYPTPLIYSFFLFFLPFPIEHRGVFILQNQVRFRHKNQDFLYLQMELERIVVWYVNINEFGMRDGRMLLFKVLHNPRDSQSVRVRGEYLLIYCSFLQIRTPRNFLCTYC